MTNKSEIPPAVVEFALEQLADNEYSAHDMATAKASGFREAEAIAAGKIAKLSARLARYEDEDGNPKAQPNTPSVKQLEEALESVRCFHDMSAELIAPAMFEHLCKAAGSNPEPHYTAHIDVRDLLKDAD